MPRSPESPASPSPFESQAERAVREPIFYFTTQETDAKNGETYEKKWVSVIGIELEVYDHLRDGGDGTNLRAEDFKDFILDEKAKSILKWYATAIRLGHPALMEGETDIGKSKALEYLAYLTNHKMCRLSAKGTTDPSEFFGKYVPEAATARQKIVDALSKKPGMGKAARTRFAKIKKEQRVFTLEDYKMFAELDAGELSGLQEESRAFFVRAAGEGRGLTRGEWEQLAEIEGIDLEGKTFVWQDGELVKAMCGNNGKGYWIYIDEVSGVEPQILLALNRVLEHGNRVELSEDGGRMVEGGEHFRIVASTNPPEYAGRIPMAPDFIRRWAYTKESALSKADVQKRLEYAFRSVPIETAIQMLLSDVLAANHDELRKSSKTILKAQKQKFNFEFSHLLRLRDYCASFMRPTQNADEILKVLSEGMDYALYSLIGDGAKRAELKRTFATALETGSVREKIKKIVDARSSLNTASKLIDALEGAEDGF